MSQILRIARREWLEQRRQPAMLAAITALFLAIATLVSLALILLEVIRRDPLLISQLEIYAPALGLDPQGMVPALAATVVSIANWLVFTQMLGICAVLAGHSVLHDRQTGTLPFLLLAPIGRAELLAGKVLGASGPAIALYWLISGASSVLAALLPVTAAQSDRLPPSPAWLVAFLLGGPLWSLAVSTTCVVISSVARDVRTAQQLVWLLMFFATFACGFLLAALLGQGPLVQLGVAAVGGVAAAVALGAGSLVVSRDLGR